MQRTFYVWKWRITIRVITKQCHYETLAVREFRKAGFTGTHEEIITKLREIAKS